MTNPAPTEDGDPIKQKLIAEMLEAKAQGNKFMVMDYLKRLRKLDNEEYVERISERGRKGRFAGHTSEARNQRQQDREEG